MFSIKILGVIVIFFELGNTAPSVKLSKGFQKELPEDPELRADLIEGDIIPNIGALNGIRGEEYRWPEKTVPYELDSGFYWFEVGLIMLGWADIEASTCIKLRPRQPEDTDYVFVQRGEDGSGCSSSVGRRGLRQVLNFEPICLLTHGTIIHELLHALGFYHEQARPDRDDYVTIAWDSIRPGAEHNFNKYSDEVIDTMGVVYDYSSLLHYGPRSFSVDGSPTIIPKDSNAEIGQRLRMSELDIYKVNLMYNCTAYL